MSSEKGNTALETNISRGEILKKNFLIDSNMQDLYQRQVQSLLDYKQILFKINMPSTDPTNFSVKIPYCGKFLQWEVIYNSISSSIPPDFIFDEGLETFVGISEIKSMMNWSPNDSNGLLKIILELIGLYRDYQTKLIKNCSIERVKFEYNTIKENPNAEFLLLGDELRCLLPLQLDFLKDEKSENFKLLFEERPKLLITFSFSTLSNDTGVRHICFNTFWNVLLSGIKFPSWTEDTLIVTYLRDLEKIVKKSFEDLLSRKRFIFSLIELFSCCLEYDSYLFQKVSFLFDYNNFAFIVHISISTDFPQKQPIIILQATAMKNGSKVIQQVYDNYPYSPRWTAEEMGKRIRSWLAGASVFFQKTATED